MNRQYLLGVIFVGVAACTTQGPEVPESSAVAASGVADEDTLICKLERPTGSLMRKKICLSAADWESVEEGAHEFFDVNRRKAAGQQ
jgi:carbonic anhydrase/acetyltransferase-like protein (isoleucine patch superfamily)